MLKLIYDSRTQSAPVAKSIPIHRKQLCLIAGALFLLLKVPMCFTSHHPEELRDFDAYVLASQGEVAYTDFVWLYGPFSPLVFGGFLKIFPHNLLTLRFVSLGLWLLATVFVTLTLSRYFQTRTSVIVGALLISGVYGYPSYSHNHVLIGTAVIACVYFFLRFVDEMRSSSLWISFLCLLVCLYTRPVVMGYGIYVCWMLLYCLQPHRDRLGRRLSVFLGLTILVGAGFYLIYGQNLLAAFLPRPWTVLPVKGYPNLHFLLPKGARNDVPLLYGWVKAIRGALETAVFYFHFFIWPSIAFTMAWIFRHRLLYRFRAGVVLAAFSLAASFDVLHYGFENPLMEQVMMTRGQYFFALTLGSLFLLLSPTRIEWRQEKLKFASCTLCLFAISLWSYIPGLIGIHHLWNYRVNPHDFPVLRGIVSHPDRQGVLEAVDFINSLCQPADRVVIHLYQPGLRHLLRCEDIFAKDAYAYTRPDPYLLSPGDTPYAPTGGVSSSDMLTLRISQLQPRFVITTIEDCSGKSPFVGWHIRDFGEGTDARRVCWRDPG